ncbi:MAG: protein-L-isoaspartate(D-aspartate) O-methyltransferase [Gallionellaceae bacterium]|jgi:protein-L-isoaspartate(D-aspartate) O-methyltransferase|nr:protein-L-isoaspartate(D-aspartate) O-methyltransferase [Gallionellaceae bacterium]
MSERYRGIGMTSQRTRNRMIERLRAEGITDEMTLAAMSMVPRHIFVDEALASRAYDNVSLPLGFGQTISQPYIVARMIEVMRAGRQMNRVLEVGTGCGYQAAVLAQVSHKVYTIERVQPLYERAVSLLQELNASNVTLRYGDGGAGWQEAAPFDGIILAAAATHVLPALMGQLALGGRMVLPLGAQEQQLCLIERDEKGFHETRLETVHFVPLLMGKT